MKTNRSLYAALIGAVIIAFAILFAPVNGDVKLAGFLSFGIVLTLLTVATIEYGRGTSRSLNR